MQKHIRNGGQKSSNCSRMACIISCWLFSTRFSPQSIFKQVLGHWIRVPELPIFLISVKISKVLLTAVYYFLQDLRLFTVYFH